MKKRILLIALAAILLLGCGIGAWLYFGQPEQTDGSGWVQAQRHDIQPGALSEYGCYYVPQMGESSIHYLDFGTGKSVVLCSRLGCSHDDESCDAYLSSQCKMFYYQDHLYYSDVWDPALYRRDATGLSLLKVGTPGKQFIEQQKSVSYDNIAPLDGWMYYQASVTSEDEDSVNITEMRYIGRINLTTGKDEVLVEDAGGSTLSLHAVRTGSVLYSRWETGDLDSSDPDYSEKFRQLKVTLERYDPETDSSTVLFEKTRAECHEIHMVYNNKVYCAIYPTGGFTDTYIYDLKTGKYSLQYENTMLRYLGGGYAFYKVGPDGEYKLMNMTTGKDLPCDLEGSTPTPPRTKSDRGTILMLYSAEEEDGSETVRQCYVPYKAMEDGLQETDLIEVNSIETSSSPSQQPTTPTVPNDGELHWSSKPIEFFTDYAPLPEEYIKKSTQYLPETVDNPNDLPILKWVFVLERTDRTWAEDAVIELNQMLAERKMPFRVQFVILMSKRQSGPVGEYDPFASEETQAALKDADLIFGMMSPDEMQDLLSPITEHVKGNAQPTLQNSVAHRLNWLPSTIDGEIYGIPQTRIDSFVSCWRVDKTLMEKAGLTASDFQCDFWEMDEIFAKLYKANGNAPFMKLENHGNSTRTTSGYYGQLTAPLPVDIDHNAELLYQKIGACFAIDNSGDAPIVVNLLEKIRFLQEAVLRYRDEGYYGTEDEEVYSVYQLGFSDINLEDGPVERDGKIIIPVSRARFDYDYGNGSLQINGIAAASQHKEEAAQLLHLLAEDDAFRYQFLYGKEGRDHTVKDGQIVPIEGENGYRYGMCAIYEEFFAEYKRISDKKDVYNTQDRLDQIEDVSYPIVFNYTGFEEELKEIGKILGKYYAIFFNNEPIIDEKTEAIREPAMDAERYDAMLQELSDAGGDEIQAELQRQLDEWLENNPDWEKQIKPAS